jgi:hypothetical protein
MINENLVDHYNTRPRIDLSRLKDATASQRDQVRHYGSQAEALLMSRDLAMFIHHFKFELADQLANIIGHTADDNLKRIAISNQLSGIDSFITSLKRAVYIKNKIGNSVITEPDVN